MFILAFSYVLYKLSAKAYKEGDSEESPNFTDYQLGNATTKPVSGRNTLVP